MKFKQIVTFIFLFSFANYNLCAILMQGDCGFDVSDATCSTACETEPKDTPQQKHRASNCCAIGLQLTRPSESHHVSQTLFVTLPLIVEIPTLPAIPSLYKSAFRADRPFKNPYDYFPVHHVSSRAPPLFLS